MNKKTMALLLACALLLLAACGSPIQETDTMAVNEPAAAVESTADAETSEAPSDTEAAGEEQSAAPDTVPDAELAIDYAHDYEPDIESDVRAVSEGSASLQEELRNVEKLSEKYAPLLTEAQTQLEMNFAADWLYHIWETELNSLLTRIRESADAETGERLLAEQTDWETMREEATIACIGTREDGGSFYPVSQFGLWSEMTKTRAYRLAGELAALRGEAFAMMDGPGKYGIFIDDQGTADIYSSLILRQGWEGDDEAIITVYRMGVLEGSVAEKGNGEYLFAAYDGSIEGVITIKGWDGAAFEVTEVTDGSVFRVGEIVDFPVAFCSIP